MHQSGETGSTAKVGLWTKGFSVTRESPEFQMVIPSERTGLRGLERSLADAVEWPRVLQGLYHLTDRDLAHERCLLVSESEAVLLVGGFMLDRHGRRGVNICSVQTDIDWGRPGLSDLVSRSHGLAVRLLDMYTSALSEKRTSDTERMLRKGAFLPERVFDLQEEKPVASIAWEVALDAVRSVRGVRGVSTPRLFGLGANVVLGTQHEAEVVQAKGASVDGFVDPVSGRVVALTTAITPWMRRAPARAEEPQGTNAPTDIENEREEASRRQAARSIEEAKQASHNLVDAWFRMLGSFFDRRQ